MSLPYEFGNYQLRKLERFIQNNGDTLLALKHITLPMAIPLKMKQRLKAINSATLRTGTLEKVNFHNNFGLYLYLILLIYF
jgi:hypothetical protein